MRGVCVLLLVGAHVTALAAVPDAEIESRLARMEPTPREIRTMASGVWTKLGREAPKVQVLAARGKRHGLAVVVPSVARLWGMSPQAAGHVVRAVVLIDTGDDAHAYDELGLAADNAPGDITVLASFLQLDMGRQLSRRPEVFIHALERAAHPADAALQLLHIGRELYSWQGWLAAYVVGYKPHALTTVLDLVGVDRAEGPTAFYLAALHTPPGSMDTPHRHALAERTLRRLVAEGLPSLAVTEYLALPRASRERILREQWAVSTVQTHHTANGVVERAVPVKDLRPSLAAACLWTGHEAEAKEILAHIPVQQEKPADDGAEDLEDVGFGGIACEDLGRAVLAARLGGKAAAFDLEVGLRRCSQGDIIQSALAAPLLSAAFQAPTRAWAARAAEVEKAPGPPMPEKVPFLKDALARMKGAQAEQRKALAAFASSAPPALAAEGGTDATGKRIMAQLNRQMPPLFEEHGLTSAPQHLPRVQPRKAKAFSLPGGLYGLRAESRGKAVTVLALSHRLDPTGEVSGDGYWLVQSRDNGETWHSTYLGLRQYRPYDLARTSQLSMVDGDTLRLEGSVRELDEGSITFPPVGLRSKREKDGVFLQASLRALQKDTDGDGLTDLVEERLMLDPANADSDGDGLRDAVDMLPNVPYMAKGCQDDGGLMAALLERLFPGRGPTALVVGMAHDAGQDTLVHAMGKPTRDAPADVTFIAGRREDCCAVKPGARFVVLARDEEKAAMKRYGAFYPLRVGVLRSEGGERVYVEWDEGWRGGAYEAVKKDGRWELKRVRSWIT